MTAVRGAVPLQNPSPGGWPVEAGQKSSPPLTVPVAGLVALAVLTPLHASWAVQLLMVPLLLIIPGVILLRALRVSGVAVAASPFYVPAASILVLTGSGLGIDLIGPLIRISAPLRSAPLLVTLEIVCIGLLMSARNASPETQIPWGVFKRPTALAWPLMLPLVGAAGALRLNSGHSNAVALIAIALVIITLVVVFLRAPGYDDALLAVVLFAAGLALMWSFSLRGDLVYGFDISSEYYSLNQTVTAGVWHVAHPNDAYGAMLSLTVFPAELHELSGVQTLFIFKVVYPVIGALFPAGVFWLARRVLAGRWAFMAAALIIMQQPFFQQLPALSRQEVATFLLTTLIAVLLDTTQAKRNRGQWAFVCLLSLGIVVSHYSTTYLAVPLLGLAVLFQWGLSWFRSMPRVTGVVLLAFVVSTAGAILWNGSITHSTSNMSQFVQNANTNGASLLPNQGGNVLSTYLQGEESQNLSPAKYQSYISNYYAKTYPFVRPLPDASDLQYDLKSADNSALPTRLTSVSSALNLAQLLVQQSTNLLAGIAALVLVVRRKTHSVATPIGLLSLAGMAMLILMRLSGTIAQAYSPQRAFMQLLIVLAIAICWLFQRLGVKRKWVRPWILAAFSASLGIALIGSTGFNRVFLGGAPAANLANNYVDYQRFVVNTQDLSAGAWVLKEAPPGQVIQTDRYGELRLVTMAGQRPGILGDITPETTDQHAWVYATRANVMDNIAQSETGAYSAAYAFPKLFLDTNFNVVYINGTSEVLHR
jgi:uncharacterized membrane protein